MCLLCETKHHNNNDYVQNPLICCIMWIYVESVIYKFSTDSGRPMDGIIFMLQIEWLELIKVANFRVTWYNYAH